MHLILSPLAAAPSSVPLCVFFASSRGAAPCRVCARGLGQQEVAAGTKTGPEWLQHVAVLTWQLLWG